MLTVSRPPRTPRTPVDVFAALLLSPMPAGQPRSNGSATPLPSFTISPPSATSSYETPTGRTGSVATLTKGSESPSPVEAPSAPTDPHRPLTPAEARQLTLLLVQQLNPVSSSSKSLMGECISLAEQLHSAGVRWDKHRRVMGMHLRGIWEEGCRWSNGVGPSHHATMERYVQGSFLSIAEAPHPLDTMPIPIPLHPATFASLPKLTLESGLAQTLRITGQAAQRRGIMPSEDGQAQTGSQGCGSALPTGTLSPMPDILGPSGRDSTGQRPSRSWRDKKAAGLKIRTDTPYKLVLRATQSGLPRSAVRSARGIHKVKVWRRRLGGSSKDKKTWQLEGKSVKMGLVGMGMGMLRFGQGVGRKTLFEAKRIAQEERRTSRRVSFGGWEVR